MLARQDDKKWNVTQPFGPFDTYEGTWTNVDVSPDGRSLVFDLLGDIWMMPIEGTSTPSKRLLGGLAFEMQPRFSPDGARLACGSGRDGLWIRWTMKTDATARLTEGTRGATILV